MRPIPPVDFHTFFSSLVSSPLEGEAYPRYIPARSSVSRFLFFPFFFLFLSFWRGARRGKILFSVKSKALESLSNLFPRVYGASEREPAIFLKEQGEQEGNDLWRSSRKKKHEIRGCIGWDDEGGSRGSSSLAGNARRIGGREESGAILRGQVLSPRPI